jgi:hypothetical protein
MASAIEVTSDGCIEIDSCKLRIDLKIVKTSFTNMIKGYLVII